MFVVLQTILAAALIGVSLAQDWTAGWIIGAVLGAAALILRAGNG